MPRRNQEAEDEAYAKALEEEYRKESIRRHEGRERRERNRSSRRDRDEDRDRDRERERSADKPSGNSGHRKKKSKDGNSDGNGNKNKKKSKKKKGKSSSRSKSRNRNRHRSRSSSHDSFGSATGKQRRRRRRRSPSEKAASISGDDWLSAYHPDQTPSALAVPALPPPPHGRRHEEEYDEDGFVPTYWGHDDSHGDEEYARRIQQEMEDAEYARRISSREREESPLREEPRATTASIPSSILFAPETNPRIFKDGNSSTGSTDPLTDDDEAVARRIQQELADAEYAQRIIALEREAAASRDLVMTLERQNQLQAQQLQQQQQQQQQAPPKSCFAKWAPIVVCIAIAVTLPLLYMFGIFNPSDIPFFGDLFEDDWIGGNTTMSFRNINGTNVPTLPSDAFGWANMGKGLELDILNACSDDWQPFVLTALENWEEGNPVDSLSLYISSVPYEEECQTVQGKLKICNGNYGDTRWRGLNEVLLSPRQSTIVASTAMLNEFYLDFESDAQKLYTCCHELGHGFGLPHWDEDFFNKDLGNCMDYTQNPQKSSTPDASNFYYLAQLYGGKNINTNQEFTAAQFTQLLNQRSAAENSQAAGSRKLWNYGANGRVRHRQHIPLSESRVNLEHIHQRHPGSESTRRILHSGEEGEVHIVESMEFPGHVVIQHFLLVQEEPSSE